MSPRTLAALGLALGALAASGALAACTATPMSSQHPTPAAFDRAVAEREIARALDDFHEAAAHADEARYFAHLAPEFVFLGTDATERWDVAAFRAFAHPHFAAGHGWTYRATRRAISFSRDGAIAWFDEDLRGEKVGPCRGSGVLVRAPAGASAREARGSTWLLTQYNLALTVPNARFSAVRAAIDGLGASAGSGGSGGNAESDASAGSDAGAGSDRPKSP